MQKCQQIPKPCLSCTRPWESAAEPLEHHIVRTLTDILANHRGQVDLSFEMIVNSNLDLVD